MNKGNRNNTGINYYKRFFLYLPNNSFKLKSSQYENRAFNVATVPIRLSFSEHFHVAIYQLQVGKGKLTAIASF